MPGAQRSSPSAAMSTKNSPAPSAVLTLDDFLVEFAIARSTFTASRRKGKAVPRFRKLPNGELRTTRTDVDAWFANLPESCGDEAA